MALISCTVTAQLNLRLCLNIFKSRFSHDAAYVIILYHDRHVEAVLGYTGVIHFVKLHSAMNVGAPG